MAEQPLARVLLLFDSRGGLTEQLAQAVAEGVRSVPGAELRYCRAEETPVDELNQCDAPPTAAPPVGPRHVGGRPALVGPHARLRLLLRGHGPRPGDRGRPRAGP